MNMYGYSLPFLWSIFLFIQCTYSWQLGSTILLDILTPSCMDYEVSLWPLSIGYIAYSISTWAWHWCMLKHSHELSNYVFTADTARDRMEILFIQIFVFYLCVLLKFGPLNLMAQFVPFCSCLDPVLFWLKELELDRTFWVWVFSNLFCHKDKNNSCSWGHWLIFII